MKTIVYFLLAAVTMFVTVGCQEEEQTKKLSKAQRIQLMKEDSAAFKVGVLPTEDCLPFVVAKELGLYKAQGVDVRLKRYNAMSECGIALRYNMVEAAVVDSQMMKWMDPEGKKFIGLMPTNATWQMLTAKKARITRIAQMNDKIIAADSHGESRRLAENAIDSMLKKGRLVFIVQVEDLNIRTNMLLTGNVDAAMLPEPFATKARKEGARVVGSVKSKPMGILLMRQELVGDTARDHQVEQFKKAIAIAEDSIQKYGKQIYMNRYMALMP